MKSMVVPLLRTRATFVLLLLIGTSVASWAFSHGAGQIDARHAGLVVITLAFVKVRFVLLDFMELRHAPLAMRLAVEAWVVVVWLLLCSLYG
jgi:hypothetical protein